ncbi:uncharacterized protein LOC129732465 [Wyeomyia smithii]|uniref:uncharacterized protein LOC129732465 n=1 Tax=Wyeomyia smithii TaxID=174621 RepID=UPI002467E910|nr:uncharacterized protein LOC129732465 [Wyeomyia smithii]
MLSSSISWMIRRISPAGFTKKEMKELSDRSASDSIFCGLLLMKLVDVEKLMVSSVTGKPCQRFAKVKNCDGTRAYPPGEKLDRNLFEFICNKVAERNAIKFGVENLAIIRANSSKAKVGQYIAQKSKI